MKTIRAPNTKQATTLMVAVKCRPLTPREHSRGRSIVRVENKMVVVSTPEMPRDFLERVNTRRKERKYTFDHAFGPESTNRNVYAAAIAPLIAGVIQGLNATIFAYGATGSGKTYTMSGTPHDPGLMVLSLQTIFDLIAKEENGHEFEVTCSYLEVYNEVIYDLLEKSSGHLELREDPSQGIMVAGLKRIRVNSAEKIFELLHMGNSRRKTESTEANATSSRSHAVLEITVKQQQKSRFRSQFLRGKLALVDLAGSERAAETNNAGQKLRDGANINRSLLALANCINALGKQQKKGLAYVPYRNSKLTRILKDGLSGNSRTVMIATVSPADDQYHHTINTLKYADRAKEIKTHIQKNIGTVDNHVADYQHMIDNLQVEVCQLKKELEAKESQLSLRPTEKSADSELSWLDDLSRDTNENVEERINLQKALFELEDINLHNRTELQKLDDIIAKQQCKEQDETIIQALRSRRQIILDNIRDNDEAGANYRKEIEINEQHRHKLQQMIDDAIHKGGNKTYLSILSQYRLLGMTNLELQFQIAFRDQIIHNQGEVQSNLWALLVSSGLNHEHIMDIAAKQGITIEDWIMPPRSPVIRKKSPVLMPGAFSHFLPSPQTSVYEILEKPCGTSSLVSAHEFSRTATLETQRNMDEKCLESTSYARNLNLFYQSLPQQPPFMQRHHCSFQISSHPCPPATLEKIHNWSSDSQIQHSCLSSPIHVPNASQGSSFYCNEAYEKLMPVTQLKTQPFTEYEQLAKGSYSSDESFVIQKDPERRKLFTNYMAVELNKDIHDNQKPNEGNVLFESPTGGGEAYFMHNEHSASISPVPYPHSIVYNNQHAYSQTHPFLSNTHYTPQDQITRKVSSMDSVYAGTKFYPCYGFKYSNSPQCQLWPN